MIVQRFPQFHPLFSIREFTWEGITQQNRNPLLYLDIGATGMKTGHTEDAGYGLTATAERDGRKVALVVAGLPDAETRRIETEKLLNWAYREFRTGPLFRAGEHVAEADVWIGAQDRVALTPEEDVIVTVPVADPDSVRARIRFEGPIAAPIAAGQPIAELVVETPGLGESVHRLVAAEGVAEGGVMKRLEAAARLLLSDLTAE
jgi:D-alanyl-D-alanine carboxypeptidase (penicillin-binding protein 5/6)